MNKDQEQKWVLEGDIEFQETKDHLEVLIQYPHLYRYEKADLHKRAYHNLFVVGEQRLAWRLYYWMERDVRTIAAYKKFCKMLVEDNNRELLLSSIMSFSANSWAFRLAREAQAGDWTVEEIADRLLHDRALIPDQLLWFRRRLRWVYLANKRPPQFAVGQRVKISISRFVFPRKCWRARGVIVTNDPISHPTNQTLLTNGRVCEILTDKGETLLIEQGFIRDDEQ